MENCPYQYLDYPKHFLGDDKFTFRSLCWWGHHLVFAMIVDGGAGQTVQEEFCRSIPPAGRSGPRALTRADALGMEAGEGYTLPITHDRKAQLAAVLSGRSWFKIARFVPLDSPAMQEGLLSELARDTFRSLLPLLTP